MGGFTPGTGLGDLDDPAAALGRPTGRDSEPIRRPAPPAPSMSEQIAAVDRQAAAVLESAGTLKAP